MNKHTEEKEYKDNTVTIHFATIKFIGIPISTKTDATRKTEFEQDSPYVVTKLQQKIPQQLYKQLTKTGTNLQVSSMIKRKQSPSHLGIPSSHDVVSVKYMADDLYVSAECQQIKKWSGCKAICGNIFKMIFGLIFVIFGSIPLILIHLAPLMMISALCFMFGFWVSNASD